MRSGGRRLPPWTSPLGAEVSRWSPCTPAGVAGSGCVTPASSCSRPPRLPSGESPYVRAKKAQLVEKDPNKAVPLFWAAINSGDRIESALKDMATVLKQANRAEEAIEAIRSFRDRCPNEAQESLDNVLLDLYKKCGRTDEQIEMLNIKLRIIDDELASGRWKTKLSRRIYISLKDEKSRLLGNLAWAYMQSENYEEAEILYRQALGMEADYNKECNLTICLMKTGRVAEAKYILETIPFSNSNGECHVKSFARATEMLMELESQTIPSPITQLKHKEPQILLAADVEKHEDFEPRTLPSPITQLKRKEPQISVSADLEKHEDFKSQTLPSPITQLKRKEPQIPVVADGEKHEDFEDEYPNFCRLFNDAATPQSVLEKLRKRLVRDDTPKLNIQCQVQTPTGIDCLPNANSTAAASTENPMQEGTTSVNGARKTWADMVEEEEQQVDDGNSTIGMGTDEQKESSKHTSEDKYNTLSFSDESKTLKGPLTGRRPPSSSAASWRHDDCKVFTDEKMSWKFVRSTPTWKHKKLQDYSNRVCQKLGTICLNERPHGIVKAPRRSGTAQRSLFSEWQSNSVGLGNGLVPFGGKEHSQDSNYTEAIKHWPNHAVSSKPWRPQNRLRVFQEITNDINKNVV